MEGPRVNWILETVGWGCAEIQTTRSSTVSAKRWATDWSAGNLMGRSQVKAGGSAGLPMGTRGQEAADCLAVTADAGLAGRTCVRVTHNHWESDWYFSTPPPPPPASPAVAPDKIYLPRGLCSQNCQGSLHLATLETRRTLAC